MTYTLTELTATLGFVGFFYLVTTCGLWVYFRKLEYSHLKFAGAAIVFELLSQAAALAGYAFEFWGLLTVGIFMKFFSATCLFAALVHVSQRAMPVYAIVFAFVSLVVLKIASLVASMEVPLAWLLLELPGVLLMGLGVALLMTSSYRTPGCVFLALMALTHMVSRLALPAMSPESLLFALTYFTSSVSVLAMAGAFIVVCSEWLIGRLDRQGEQLTRYEQENLRLELQFSQAQKLESLGMLAGGIAHDFNNMLTSILGYTSIAMKKLPPDSPVRKDLYMVMSGARQAVDLTSQMLAYAGKGAIEFESLDISKVVDNMSGLVNSIVPRKIHLTHRVANDLPFVRGDAIQLGQVVMNLVANSVDAIQEGEGTIEVETGLSTVDSDLMENCLFAEDKEPGTFVYLRIRDTGVGMQKDQVALIFDPFFTDKDKSKGLGLSSLSGIVRQHKGFVHVDTALGEGAVFTVYLPILAYRDVQPAGSRGIAGLGAGKGRVLLADDDSRIRGLIASILESDSYMLTSVEDGREVMKRIAEDGADYDAFVIDCTMPKLSGTEVYREIRSSGLQTPVILISGYHQEQVLHDISRDNNAYFIKKPFSVDELLETVNASIARSPRRILN